MTESPPRRRGRPRKEEQLTTRENLLDAAAERCVGVGFENVRLAEVAARAGVTTAAIYNHFVDRDDLLYAAGRRALGRLADQLSLDDDRVDTLEQIAAAFLHPEMRSTRQLILELHRAGKSQPKLASHLADWHLEFAEVLRIVTGGSIEDDAIKSVFLVLLGACHLEDLDAIDADPSAVRRRIVAAVQALTEARFGSGPGQ